MSHTPPSLWIAALTLAIQALEQSRIADRQARAEAIATLSLIRKLFFRATEAQRRYETSILCRWARGDLPERTIH